MQAFTKEVIVDTAVRNLCVRPYPNHPKGCPNFGKRESCPPKCKLLGDIYDLTKGFWVVWVEFNFMAHCNRMRKKHLDWSQRQIECCLYWQGTANKMLREAVDGVSYYLQGTGNWKAATCPEAMGVNITATMKTLDVELEWPPVKAVYKVALIGCLAGD